MVEKIIVNPNEIRGYGNIISPKTSTDFTPSTDYKVVQSTDTVYGTETTVYGIESVYTVSFDSESYTTSTGVVPLTVTVMKGTTPVVSGTVSVTGAGGSGSGNLVIGGGGVVYITVTGITESGTLTSIYKSAKATVPVTYEQSSYSLAFSQDTYEASMFGDVTISCTLTDNGSPVSGETVTFTWMDLGDPYTATATTDSNGVATKQINVMDSTVVITATYGTATATCNVTHELPGGLD